MFQRQGVESFGRYLELLCLRERAGGRRSPERAVRRQAGEEMPVSRRRATACESWVRERASAWTGGRGTGDGGQVRRDAGCGQRTGG